MKNNNVFVPQQLQTPPSQRQQLPQPTQPDHSAFVAGAQHPQWSHFQAPPAPAYHLQPSQHPPPDHSAFYTYDDYGPQWHGQHQFQYHVPFPIAQPVYSPYQPVAGYPQYYVPQPIASPQPQLPYYSHLQLQQQQRLHHTPPQDLRQVNRQRFDDPDLTQAHRALQSSQPQYQPLPLPAHNTWICLDQSQESNCGTRGGFISGNRGEIADSSRGGSHENSGDGDSRVGQSGDVVLAHCSVGGVTSIQAEGHNAIPTSAAPAPVPVPTQFQGAHGVNISGNTRFTNIGMNTGNLTTVNNYGGTHGLENLKDFISFAALYDSAEQDPDRRCHPGTRKAVLRQLRDWIDNPNPTDRIFWLHGPAGAGKSAIAQTIADEYKEQGVAATFFFFRSDPSCSDGNRLFPTIAWQLAFSVPAIKDFIGHALDKSPHLPTKRVETQFEQLVAHPFCAMNHIATQMVYPALVVIVDGVDECSDEHLQRRFLTVIGDAVKDTRIPLRFLIVSRPEALIEGTLNKFKDFTVSIDLAKLDDSSHDIQKYLEDKFSEIASICGLDPTWPGQKIIEEIVFKSSGNFIFASVVIRFISNEDCDPEFLLDIVRNLMPRGHTSPFALLDELYLQILKQQRDQGFLKTFLALLVARSSIEQDDLHKDDATLMNVSEKDLHIRLRRMRSLLKFEPFIDVYHRSFLDFVQDPSRSGQYHISKEGGLKRYLELIVDSVVRHVSMAIEQPNCHRTCHSGFEFKCLLSHYPPKIVVPVTEWQEAVKPLLDLQDKLLRTSKPQECCVIQIMRNLLLHLVFLQGKSHAITTAQVPESNINETVTEWSASLVTEAQKNIPEKDLDSCLSALLLCLQKTDLVIAVNRAIIDHMLSLLAFDYAETAARVRTVSDAQKLIDLIDLLTNNECLLSQCGPDVAYKAAQLASEIFARVPLLPQSLFLNNPGRHGDHPPHSFFEFECQSALISRILDHNCIVPVSGICDAKHWLGFATDNENNSVTTWLRSSPNLVTRIKIILEVARTIRYIHSMDVVLYSNYIKSGYIFLNSNLRTKFEFYGLFGWSVREALIDGYGESCLLAGCTYESNIFAFACLFQEVCFRGPYRDLSNRLVEDAMQLVEQCSALDPKSRPIMKDVVAEMETWHLTETA